MNYYDVVLYLFFIIILILIIINYIYLTRNNDLNDLLEINKITKESLNENLRNKLPLIITGEIEDWYIFNNQDQIDKNKLTKKILSENASKLLYPLNITKKIITENILKNNNTKIKRQLNTRNFLGVLGGKISVYLFHPTEFKKIKNKDLKRHNFYKNPEKFKDIKYIEVIMNSEKLLYIPFNWYFCYKVLDNSILLNINSESLFTLPIKFIYDKYY